MFNDTGAVSELDAREQHNEPHDELQQHPVSWPLQQLHQWDDSKRGRSGATGGAGCSAGPGADRPAPPLLMSSSPHPLAWSSHISSAADVLDTTTTLPGILLLKLQKIDNALQ